MVRDGLWRDGAECWGDLPQADVEARPLNAEKPGPLAGTGLLVSPSLRHPPQSFTDGLLCRLVARLEQPRGSGDHQADLDEQQIDFFDLRGKVKGTGGLPFHDRAGLRCQHVRSSPLGSTPRLSPMTSGGGSGGGQCRTSRVENFAANMSAREGRPIEFKNDWFTIESDDTPEGIAPDLSRYKA